MATTPEAEHAAEVLALRRSLAEERAKSAQLARKPIQSVNHFGGGLF
jgi:hypothetical protein